MENKLESVLEFYCDICRKETIHGYYSTWKDFPEGPAIFYQCVGCRNVKTLLQKTRGEKPELI